MAGRRAAANAVAVNPELSLFGQVALVTALLVLVLGALASPLRSRGLSLPLIAMAAGAALGPFINLGRLHDSARFTVLFDLASLALATGLFGTALQLPRWYVVKAWREILLLIGVLLPLSWLTAGAVTYFSLGLAAATSFLIGACLAPTDPILARTVALGDVARKNVPERVRYVLLGESSVNDGAALPIVVLVAGLLPGAGFSPTEWLTVTVLWGVGASVPLGLAIGWAGAWAERFTLALQHATPPTFRAAFPLSLAILSLMLLRLAHVDGVLGVFFTGLAFRAFRKKEDRREEAELQEIVDDFFSVTIFFVFGLLLPWAAWGSLGWSLLPLVAGVLLLRRLPWLLLLGRLTKDVRGPGEAAFVGWFGPMGVSALFYVTLLVDRSVSDMAWPPVAAVVAASVVVFGLTGTPLARRLHRYEARRGADAAEGHGKDAGPREGSNPYSRREGGDLAA